jgi:acetyl esterase/lipase
MMKRMFPFVCFSLYMLMGLPGIVPPAHAEAPVYLLWPAGAPGAIGNETPDQPSVQVFMPTASNTTGTAIIVCAGGAYVEHMAYEGELVAHWLSQVGVTAFVLQYRIAPRYHYPIPGEDAMRAIRFVRYNAAGFHIAPDRIGIMGFSAGGHVASTAATHFQEASLNSHDPVDMASSRPDFAILAYSIISMRPNETDAKTAKNFFGDTDSPRAPEQMTNYLHVTDQTPPVFLFHTSEDRPVPVENSVLFYTALRQHHVPVEMHLFEKGAHGAGLADGIGGGANNPYLAVWPKLAENWLRVRGLLPARPASR